MKNKKTIAVMLIFVLLCSIVITKVKANDEQTITEINNTINNKEMKQEKEQMKEKEEVTNTLTKSNQTQKQNIDNSNLQQEEIKIEYEYKQETNTVLATVTAKKELQPTKISWKLSADKKQYTYEFNGNTNYTTNFIDIDGKIMPIEIKVTQIDESPAKLTIQYEYKKNTNTVLATVKSNRELQPTKISWKLSADKKQYTYEFNGNTNYTTNFIDMYGNVIPLNINVTQINKKPQANLTIEYEYKQATNTVIATVKSDIELQPTKVSWNLSADKKQYIYEFNGNTNYTTNFVDIYGNIIPVEINVKQIDETPKQIKVEYKYTTRNTVYVTVKSEVELQPTKISWNLSLDNKQYTYEFYTNTDYVTNFIDIYGNVIPVHIEVNQINETIMKVDYKYKEDTSTVLVTVSSNNEFQETKVSWKLSEDKKQYTCEFNTNTDYTTNFVDIYGRVQSIHINVTQIDTTPPEISVEYILNKNGTVTVNLHSNKKLGATKLRWTLSEDKLTYTRTFDTDQDYTTDIRDINQNLTKVKLDFKLRKYTYHQEDNSTIEVKYLYKGRTEAIVQITSSVKLVNTKPNWNLSEDGHTYTAKFYSNNIYVTPIKDISGMTKDVNIIVNLFGNYLSGIDVSAHQGKIDWAQVKNSGVDFAILRCGYGQDDIAQDDTYFMRNVMECERLGIPYGVYLYSYALNEQAAYSEVNHVLRLIRGHNPTYGVWIDMEDADGYKLRNGMPSDETLVNICDIFCQEIQKNGYNAGVYASLTWFNSKLSSNRLDKYNKWVAQWNSSCSYDKRYVMWQYTSSGSVNGILTNVDMDIYYR